MSESNAYKIEFTPDAIRHLKSLRAYDRTTVTDSIDEQLKFEPETATRKRKQLQPNDWADWELRVGDHRVLYNVEGDRVLVLVVAIGEKDGNRLIIDGEEVTL